MKTRPDLSILISGQDMPEKKLKASKNIQKMEKDDKVTNKYSQKTIGRFNKWLKDEIEDVLEEIHEEQAELAQAEEASLDYDSEHESDYGNGDDFDYDSFSNSDSSGREYRIPRVFSFFKNSRHEFSEEENQFENSIGKNKR